MKYKAVILILLFSSLFFAVGMCPHIITGNEELSAGAVYSPTSPEETCITIDISGAPTDVFINLNGATITGSTNNASGIHVTRNTETSVTIENGTISNSYYAVLLNGISVTLRNVTILNSGYGIYINSSSENNTISNITINNSDIGIYTLGFTSTITNVTITNSTRGILLASANNTLRNVTINNTYYSFGVTLASGGLTKSVADLTNDIDRTNVIDGRSIYYQVSSNNLLIGRNNSYTFGGDPSAVYLINCTNALVENITSQFMEQAVVAAWGNNITFSNITVNETFDAVNILDAHNVTIKDSIIGAYGSGYYDALPRICGGGCSVVGITIAYANNTNITRARIKDFSSPIICSNLYDSSITNNTIIGYNEVGKAGMQITSAYNSVISYNNLTYSPWTTRPADTRRTNYSLLAPITTNTCSGYGCYYEGITLSGENNTLAGNRVYNTTVGLYTLNAYNSTIHGLYIYNSSDGVAFENSANVTFNYSTITNGYFTGYKLVDFRSLGTNSFNVSLHNITFTSTRISMDFTGNLTINSSFNLSTETEVQTGVYTGAAVNITNDSYVTANLTMYYPSGYDSMTVFRYPGNSTTTWINVSNDLGVTHTADYTFGNIRMLNLTNFSVYAIFGSKIPAPTPVVPDSGGIPTPSKPEISLSISKTCPGGDIIISSEKGASITIMFPNGWSDSGKIGDSGIISFAKRGEGTVDVLGSHPDYSAVEKTYEYTNCPTPALSVSSSYSCSESSVTYTVTADGTIVGDAAVTITTSDGASRSGTTGADGKISFPVELGRGYSIIVTKDQYTTYRDSETYALCTLTATGSLKCPEKTYAIIVTSSDGQIISEALVEYNGVINTDASGTAVFAAFNGTKNLIVTKKGYQTYENEISLESPCYTSTEPKEKPPEEKPEKPGDEKPGDKPGTTTGQTTGGTSGTTTGTTGQTKPSGGAAGSIEETIRNSLDKLKDAVVELTDTNEKKIAAAVILIIAGFLAYNYLIVKHKPFKPKIKKDDD